MGVRLERGRERGRERYIGEDVDFLGQLPQRFHLGGLLWASQLLQARLARHLETTRWLDSISGAVRI